MKKAISILIYLLFALLILYPAGALATRGDEYSFELISVPAFALLIAMLSFCIFLLRFVYKLTVEGSVAKYLLAFSTPLALINALLYIAERPRCLVIASFLITTVCCCILTVDSEHPALLNILSLSISAMMALPVGFLVLIVLSVGSISGNTVVKTAESPDGQYYAQVIESNHGATGGATYVDVYEKSGFNAVIFKIERSPNRVYCGNWGEANDMEIYWTDDNRLVIN